MENQEEKVNVGIPLNKQYFSDVGGLF